MIASRILFRIPKNDRIPFWILQKMYPISNLDSKKSVRFQKKGAGFQKLYRIQNWILQLNGHMYDSAYTSTVWVFVTPLIPAQCHC